MTRAPLPHDLRAGDQLWEDVGAQLGDPAIAPLMRAVGGTSPYLSSLVRREIDWLAEIIASPAPAPEAFITELTRDLEPLVEDKAATATLSSGLRQAKRRAALFTGLADLAGVWELDQTTESLTHLADRACDLAFRHHLAEIKRRGKLPAHEGASAGLFILAMGKMGAYELNYSSDIDLIVLFDDQIYAPDDRYEARSALVRATRSACRMISDVTDEGYVFRTDLRLRPDPQVTPVCLSTSAALSYYEAEGRAWERAAFIKARVCAGDFAAGTQFLDEMRPFTWRRHLDFAAIDEAHQMRLKIRAHRGLNGSVEIPGHDIKLGIGGIREIEFFTQTSQLIVGGRDPSLRVRGTVEGLAALAKAGRIDEETATRLAEIYRSHRDIEHRIQMIQDAQTHHLPQTQDGLDRVARMSGVANTEEFCADLARRLAEVDRLTDDFFAPDPVGVAPDLPHDLAEIVARWSRYTALKSERGRQVFDRIEAAVLDRVMQTCDPQATLRHFDAFLAGLPSGVQLFSLFEANPHLLDLLVDICSAAPRLAHHLSRHSAVLDAVLVGSFFAPWPGGEALEDELRTYLDRAAHASSGDYERVLDAARRWTHEWQFRVGVHHLRGLISAEEAGTQYADIADAVIRCLLPVATAQFSTRYGPPPGKGMALLAMGSLGARQLTATSDLDLVVIYDAGGCETSQGPRPLAVRTYYARLTQAVVTALTTPTAEGRLFEVDMRLRPSGKQGPVAASLASFAAYHAKDAWTWEHLALTRARVVASYSDELSQSVEDIRREVMRMPRDVRATLLDLARMRERIFDVKTPDGLLETKIGPGRLQDIELFAQCCALLSNRLSRQTLGQLALGVEEGLIDDEQAELMSDAYRLFWGVQSTTRLLQDGPIEMGKLSGGAVNMYLRETGAADLSDIIGMVNQRAERVAKLITSVLSDGMQTV